MMRRMKDGPTSAASGAGVTARGSVAVVLLPLLALGTFWYFWVGSGDELADKVAANSTVLEDEAGRRLADTPVGDSNEEGPRLPTAGTGGDLEAALQSIGVVERFRLGSVVVFTVPRMGYYGEGRLVFDPQDALDSALDGDCPYDAAAPKRIETRALDGSWKSVLWVECDPFSSQAEGVFAQRFLGWLLFIPAAGATAALSLAAYRLATARRSSVAS
jgi:hypothetical protein